MVGHGWGGHAGLGEVCQQRGEDVPGELGVRGRHLQLLPPDPVEDVLQVVPVSNPHIHLLALKVDDRVLAAVLETVLVGRHRVVGQDFSKPEIQNYIIFVIRN